jgi:hypothetical protein
VPLTSGISEMTTKAIPASHGRVAVWCRRVLLVASRHSGRVGWNSSSASDSVLRTRAWAGCGGTVQTVGDLDRERGLCQEGFRGRGVCRGSCRAGRVR